MKLTFGGSNQFIFASTYLFLFMVVFFLLFQLNYLNLALDLFSAAAVSPIYYVFFTSCTIVSNTLLFQGFEGQTAADVINDLMGFCAMVLGVFLLYHPQTPATSGYLPANDQEVMLEMNSSE